MKISEADFINQYIESNECTLEEFHDCFEVLPCSCGQEECEGWKVIFKETTL